MTGNPPMPAPGPAHPVLPEAPALIGVGVGPGDPELVTRRAVRVLRAAEVVVAPVTTEGTAGRAEAIAVAAAGDLPVERHPFPMVHDDEARHRAFAASAERIAAHLDEGRLVAFVTLGDPSVYSTFPSVVAALHDRRPDAVTACVPGIMAAQELAARTGTVLTDGTETLVLTTALGDHRWVQAALDDPACAVVVYKVGDHLPALVATTAQRGRQGGAVYGEQLGLAGERLAPVPDLSGPDGAVPPAPYLSTVLVPPVARRADGGLR